LREAGVETVALRDTSPGWAAQRFLSEVTDPALALAEAGWPPRSDGETGAPRITPYAFVLQRLIARWLGETDEPPHLALSS
jgi:hypothetical protein